MHNVLGCGVTGTVLTWQRGFWLKTKTEKLDAPLLSHQLSSGKFMVSFSNSKTLYREMGPFTNDVTHIWTFLTLFLLHHILVPYTFCTSVRKYIFPSFEGHYLCYMTKTFIAFLNIPR